MQFVIHVSFIVYLPVIAQFLQAARSQATTTPSARNEARKAGHGEEQGGGGCRLAVYYASKMLEPSSWGKRSYCLFSLVFMPYTISWQNKYFTGTEFCHAKLGRKMFDNATWCVTHDFIYYFSYKFFFSHRHAHSFPSFFLFFFYFKWILVMEF